MPGASSGSARCSAQQCSLPSGAASGYTTFFGEGPSQSSGRVMPRRCSDARPTDLSVEQAAIDHCGRGNAAFGAWRQRLVAAWCGEPEAATGRRSDPGRHTCCGRCTGFVEQHCTGCKSAFGAGRCYPDRRDEVADATPDGAQRDLRATQGPSDRLRFSDATTSGSLGAIRHSSQVAAFTPGVPSPGHPFAYRL
jgi:hypothetical protein